MYNFKECSAYFKTLEQEVERRAKREDIVVLRLDGKNFSALKHKYKWQADTALNPTFVQVMTDLTHILCQEYSPLYAFVGSDEISLVFWNEGKAEHPFGARVQKMGSLIASFTSCHATRLFEQAQLVQADPAVGYPDPVLFDCRMLIMTSDRVTDYINHRAYDVHRNAVRTDAQRHLSHKQLMQVSDNQIVLHVKETLGVDLSDDCKRYFGKVFIKSERMIPLSEKLTPKKLAELVEKGHVKADGMCTLKEWVCVDVPHAGMTYDGHPQLRDMP